jgi:predicted nucleic acid-binding protein
MNILYDSSSLLALYVENHPHNDQVVQTYSRQKATDNSFYMSIHSIAELYSNLTRGKQYFDYSAEKADQLINKIVDTFFSVVSLNEEDYLAAFSELKEKDLTNGIVYDGIISQAAHKIEADILVTINEKDFKRLAHIHGAQLVNPLKLE